MGERDGARSPTYPEATLILSATESKKFTDGVGSTLNAKMRSD